MSKMSPKIKAIWASILSTTLVGLTGLKGWAIKLILNYGGQYLYNLIDGLIKKLNRTEKQNEAKKEYEKVDKDPNSTPDERGDKYEKFINS